MPRFKLPPLDRGTDDSVRYALTQIELFLNDSATDPLDEPFADHIGQRHTLMHTAGALLGGTTNGTRAFGLTGFSLFGSNVTNPLHLIRLTAADFAVDGATAKLRTRGNVMVNATAPGAALDFELGLYPVSAVAGASGGVTYTAGTVIAGSTFTFNSGTALAASTRYADESATFSVPTAEWCALGVKQTGGTVAAASQLHFSARLHVHYE